MIRRDNTDVEIGPYTWEELRDYIKWLDDRNIKYSMVKKPIWTDMPVAINMRNEDAIMFRLTFGL